MKAVEKLLKNKKFCETIDGELLGDGCIIKDKRGYHTFAYSTSNEEYAEFLHSFIANKTGSKSSLYICKPRKPHLNPKGKRVFASTSYQFRICHKIFEHFYKRWYVPKKQVPNDIKITPTSCRHWYIGDGTINNKRSLTIKLSTECFAKSDLNMLAKKLCDIGIGAKLYLSYKDRFCIAIYASSALAFLKYIGKCPVKSYKYKWDTNSYRKRRKKCICGKWFCFFSHVDRQFYCSSSCQNRNKNYVFNKKLSNTKRDSLIYQATQLDSEHFYYILGHALCTGKIITKNVVSIKVLDLQLTALMCDKTNCKHGRLYDNTLSFYSKQLVTLLERLSNKPDFSKVPKKYNGDILRGIFDAAGTINLASDNHFQIVFRYKHSCYLSTILGVKNPTRNNVVRIKKYQRELIFNKLYIHKDEIRSKKKYDLFYKSLNSARKSIPKDEKGRFKSLNAK